MSGATSSRTAFFSFGLNDGFISKSFEGLRYRNLPPSLLDLILNGSVLDVHWACLGPLSESWLLSFKDASGKHNLGWGSGLPQRLQTILAKVQPSPYFRASLGPKDSFIAWNSDFIRWGGLPPLLEDRLQSWLTPSGWRVGPPRMITWGKEDVFFTMSEYGDVAYRLGDGNAWEIYKETVADWRAEKGFRWSELAYISLDQTTSDQFISIRNDGTWAGSIDDTNEEALEAFALNFFSRSTSKSQAKKSSKKQPNGHTQTNAPPSPPKSPEAPPNPATQALYEKWATETASLLASALAAISNTNSPPPTPGTSPRPKAPRKLQIRNPAHPSIPTNTSSPGKLLTTFPYLPTAVTTCTLPACIGAKSDDEGIKACKHDVERLLRASGLYSYEWLRQERIRWHPDRFGRLCDEAWRERGRRLAEEMFKIVDALVDVEKGATSG